MKFPKNIFVDGAFSNSFLESARNIVFGREVIHHSHIKYKIIGYARNFHN